MCEGLKELCKDYYDEGFAKGKQQGYAEGEAIGKQQGFAEGKAKVISETTLKLVQAMRSEGISEELIQSICSKVKDI